MRLSWSPDGKQLASGGNDNMCCIWDMNQSTPHTFDHKAAVKALAWCPFQANLPRRAQGLQIAEFSFSIPTQVRSTCRYREPGVLRSEPTQPRTALIARFQSESADRVELPR